MSITNDSLHFSKGEIVAAIQIWNRAAVSLLDIRHSLISPDQPVRSYHLPASAFVFTSGGKAEVLLNDTAYNVERFGLFHGGKGMELSITPHCDWLETYTVLYKAAEPPHHRGDYQRQIQQLNPFAQQYGFVPDNPIFYTEELRKLYEQWKGATVLNRFYGKTAFYRLVYEVYAALDRGGIQVLEPDVTAMAQRYLDRHYAQAISIQELCEVFGISYSHFHRSFKLRTGKSPQEYLIHTRLAAAKGFLKQEGFTVSEVAGYCGFQDERNFQRLFCKHVGISPTAYRENTPLCMRDDTVGSMHSFPYNWESQVNLGKLMGKGANEMLKQMRGKAVIAAALSLMLLMSACAAAPTNSAVTDVPPTPAVTEQVEQPQATQPVEEGTRTISTVKGDVEVPMNPKRIVTYYMSGNVYAFDIEPVGIDSAYEGAGFFDLVKEAQVVNFTNAEEVMTLEPDLILMHSDYFYNDMSKIAPTVIVPYEMPLEEQILFMGEILNQEQKAEEIVSNYRNAIEQSKQALESAGLLSKTITVVEGGNTEMRVHGSTYVGGPSILYNAFGFKAPDTVEEDILAPGKSGSGISMEALPKYIEDIVVQFVWEGMDDMSTNEIWNSLPAVKNGQLIEIPFSMAHYPDVLSQMKQIKYLSDSLLALK